MIVIDDSTTTSVDSHQQPPHKQQQHKKRPNQTAAAATSAAAAAAALANQAAIGDEDNTEEWLHHYMLGKIKEKRTRATSGSEQLLECLQHYKRAYECLERSQAEYLKRITYKTKSYLSVESNEVFYRIYAHTLKRIERLASSPTKNEEKEEEQEEKGKELRRGNDDQCQPIARFLDDVLATRFVTAHNDLHLSACTAFLHANVFAKSERIARMTKKGFSSFFF